MNIENASKLWKIIQKAGDYLHCIKWLNFLVILISIYMIEIILGIFIIVVVGFYLLRPTSKQEEKDLKSKNNWRGGF